MSKHKDNNNNDKGMSEREQELEAMVKRAQADYSNLQKRYEREKQEFVKFSNEALLLQITHIANGLELTLRELNNLLEKNGFVKVPVNSGDKFDPNVMEAIDKKDDGEDVIEVYSPAYKLHDRIVQPARVALGKHHKKHKEDKK